MPPKPKNTREEIAAAAFTIIKEEGLEALTARELGRKLNSSAGSIFTLYPSMEDVKLAARRLALEEFRSFISDYKEYSPPFKRIGQMIVTYGKREPELFKLLFMQEHQQPRDFTETMMDLDDVYQICTDLIQRDYGLAQEGARFLFEQMWILAFGLGTMCALGVCTLEDDEIGRRLSVSFMSLYAFIKSGKLMEVYASAEKNPDGTFHGHLVGDLFNLLFDTEQKQNHTHTGKGV